MIPQPFMLRIHITRASPTIRLRSFDEDLANSSAASQEPLRTMRVSRCLDLNMLRLPVITSPACEKALSEGVDDAETARAERATCSTSGYLCAVLAHHSSRFYLASRTGSMELSQKASASIFLCTSSISERLAMAFSVEIVNSGGAPSYVSMTASWNACAGERFGS